MRFASSKPPLRSGSKHPKWYAPTASVFQPLILTFQPIEDSEITIRFRLGVHTIFLFVDSLKPFSDVTPTLFDILRERYPDGMTVGHELLPVPTAPSAGIAYATALKVPGEAFPDWKWLEPRLLSSTPQALGVKNNDIIAFAFVDDEDEVPEFRVNWPESEPDTYEG